MCSSDLAALRPPYGGILVAYLALSAAYIILPFEVINAVKLILKNRYNPAFPPYIPVYTSPAVLLLAA